MPAPFTDASGHVHDYRRLTTAGQLPPFQKRDSSYSGGTAGYACPLTVVSNDHYTANVTDSVVGWTCVETQTLESKYSGGTNAVRAAIYGYPFVKYTDGAQRFWLLREVYFPTDFPTLPTTATATNPWLVWGSVARIGYPSSGRISMHLRNFGSGNEFTWTAPEVNSSYLWRQKPATKGVWHVVAQHLSVNGISKTNAWMEIWYGQRGSDGRMKGPMQIQTLTSSSGITLSTGSTGVANTRRTNMEVFTSDSSNYPGHAMAHYNYHRGGMFSGTIRIRHQGVVFDMNVPGRTIADVDPFYFEGTNMGLPGTPTNIRAVVGQY
jgi:hypothetical protein